MTRSLLWKEWREQRWKLAFGCVLLLGFTAISLRARMIPDMATLLINVLLGGFCLSLMVAIGIVASDRESGALDFTLALPAAPRRILAVKTAVALSVAFAPLVGAAALFVFMAGGRELSSWTILPFFGAAIWIALNLIVWTLAFGLAQPTEARAGFVGLFVIGGWALGAALVEWNVHGGAESLFNLWNPIFTVVWAERFDGLAHYLPRMHLLQFVATIFAQTSVLVILWWGTSRRFATLRRSAS